MLCVCFFFSNGSDVLMKVFAEEKGKRFLEAAKHLTPDHAGGDRVDEDVKVFIDWFTSGVAEKSKALKKMAKVERSHSNHEH